jgi:hypothetical protein
MFMFIFIVFILFINNNIIIYNENFLLCIFLILFFILIYLVLNKNIKIFLFFKVFQSFYMFLMLFKMNIFINKLCKFFYLRKKYLLKTFKIKVLLSKKNIFMVYNKITEKDKFIINLSFLLNNKRYIRVIRNFNNFLFFNFDINVKCNDVTLLH